MRLPWPFGKAQRSVVGDAPAARAEWRDLGEMPRTLADPPLVAPTPPFAASLAGASPAPIALAPLAHSHGMDAPVGLVGGLARAIGAPRPAAPMPAPGRRVQRSPTTTSAVGASAGDETPAVRTAGREAAVPVHAPPLVTQPIRPKQLLTSAAHEKAVQSAAPAGHVLPARPAISRTTAPPAMAPNIEPPSRPTASLAAPQTSGPAPRLAPLQRSPAASAAEGPRTETASRLTLGQARRLGLGAPLHGPALSLAKSRPVGDTSAPESMTAQSAASSTAPSRPVELPSAPTTARSIIDSAAPVTAGGSSPASSPSPVAAARPVSSRAVPLHARAESTRPLVSAHPIRQRVQRAPLATSRREPIDEPASLRAPSSIPPAADAPVRVHRGAEATQLAGALEARAFTHGGDVYLPASQGPLRGSRAGSLLAHELTHVAQQRKLGSNLPGEDTPAGRSLEARAVAAEKSPPLPLAGAPAARPAAAAASSGHPQRKGATTDDAAAADAATVELPPIESPTQRAPKTASTAGSAASDKRSEQELEDLARDLYPRIGLRLRRELLDERERIGALVDR